MYGLVNRAIEELVLEQAGPAAWNQIRKRAQLQIPGFVSMQAYPDAITYALVGAASQVLDIAPSELLRAFGRHWILFTGREGYGSLLEAAGQDLREFLLNLDALHARLGLSMPELVPPSFSVEEADGALRVEYRSTRVGLAPMVVGLLEGLGELFDEPVSVEHVQTRDEERHDVFVVRPKAP
ncbi:MAG: heme NO-binding domain-containing protein [Myxococcota bacterium]